MTFHRARTFLLLYTTVLFSSCQKENAFDCLKSTGKIKTEIRSLPPFNTLKVYDNLDVILVQDSEWYAEVKAGENLQGNILTEVKNGELQVTNINKCNWIRSYKKPMEIRIHLPQILNIFQLGYGTISNENTLKNDTIFLHLVGAGDIDLRLESKRIWMDMYELGNIKLAGTNNLLTAYVGGNGILHAENLVNQEISMQVGNSGDAHVKAEAFLGAYIKSSGSVYYYGSPQRTDFGNSGTGQFVRVN